MSMNVLFWLVVVITLGVYATMLFWSIPTLSQDAGGLAIFDMRPGGYSFEEARAILTVLSPEGVSFYKSVQHRLDALYPALLAITLGWSILRLSPVSWGIWRWVLAATAVPGMLFDYWENADVSFMLDLGPDGITPAIVEAASLHSRIKAGASTVAMTILVVLCVAWLIRRLRFRSAR